MQVGDLVKKFKGDKDHGMLGLIIGLGNEITEYPDGEVIVSYGKVTVNTERGVRRWDRRGVEVIK
tara:strand:- start:425 stop:619 length:195 start_codon:yes stop_codon:yes gene_type:complete